MYEDFVKKVLYLVKNCPEQIDKRLFELEPNKENFHLVVMYVVACKPYRDVLRGWFTLYSRAIKEYGQGFIS